MLKVNLKLSEEHSSTNNFAMHELQETLELLAGRTLPVFDQRGPQYWGQENSATVVYNRFSLQQSDVTRVRCRRV